MGLGNGFGFAGGAVVQTSGGIWQFVTPEIDFTAAPADVTFNVGSGLRFYFNTFQVVTTQATAVVTQPTVRCGITGTPQKYLANTLCTFLTAQYLRQIFNTLLADEGEATVVMGISTAGVGTNYKGKLQVTGTIF